MQSVMTPGVAPWSSEACTLPNRHMTDDQTTLSEFDGGETARSDAPTPETNADDIQRLVTLLERLTDRVGSLVDQVGQHDDAGSIDTEPTDATRMFQ